MKKLTFLPLLFLFVSCNQKLSDHDVILKIGDFEVTNYTLHKKVNRIFPDPNLKNPKSLEIFRNNFINSYFIIADAYQKEYDTLAPIQNKLKYNTDRTMIERGGQLWNKLVGPRLYDSIQITPDKIEKRSKLFYFDIIGIGNKEEYLILTDNDTSLQSKDDFIQLKNKCSKHVFLNSSSATMQWPFVQFDMYAEYIYTMSNGQVSKLLNTNNGSFYLYLDHMEIIELTPDEENKLRYQLQQIAEEQIYKEKDLEMLAAGNPEINEKTIELLVTFINEGNELKDFPGNPSVINYTHNGNYKQVYFRDYITPILQYPTYEQIENEFQLRESILDCYYTNCLVQEAHDLGLYEDELFALDCKSLLNSYVYYEYIDKEIRNTIEIDTSDVITYYNKNTKRFTEPETVIFNCYFFDDEHTASCNWQAIMNFYQHNDYNTLMSSKHLFNLNSILPNHKIKIHNCDFANKEFLNELRYLQPGYLSKAMPYMGKYALFFRIGQEGEVNMKLDDVYKNIELQLLEERTQFLLEERYADLKKKYPLEIDNIDIKELM